jgi:hypothetical protein
VDLIFAFAYDYRTTLGDPTVESHWTLRKLSATLSWFEQFETLQDAVYTCIRRALAYPLYRHWGLCVQVVRDTQAIFRNGKRAILKGLLSMRRSMVSEFSSHMNNLYLDDYCCWIQSAKYVGGYVRFSLARSLALTTDQRTARKPSNPLLMSYKQYWTTGSRNKRPSGHWRNTSNWHERVDGMRKTRRKMG